MTPLCAVILISVLAAIAAFQTSPRAGNDGWISMFDGATLTGWQANEHPESWKVVDGAIVGDGPTSHLFWMVRECDDCGFRAEVKLKPQRKLRHVSTQDVIV